MACLIGDPANPDKTRETLEVLAGWLDNSIRLPGGFRIGADAIVGLVPLAGDVFDAAWKSNQRNVSLLEGNLDAPAATTATSGCLFALLVLGWLLFRACLTVLSALFFSWAWHFFRG